MSRKNSRTISRKNSRERKKNSRSPDLVVDEVRGIVARSVDFTAVVMRVVWRSVVHTAGEPRRMKDDL